MKQSKTIRGFGLVEFTDRYGAKCSLQESSLGTEACIWLGVDDAPARMHLTQQMVAELLPALQHFVATGLLP